MAKTRRTTFDKLQRERARQAKQAEKRERRQARRNADPSVPAVPPPVPSRDAESRSAGSDDEASADGRFAAPEHLMGVGNTQVVKKGSPIAFTVEAV